MNVWRGTLAGAAGGIAGAAAMVVFNHLLARTGVGRDDLGARKQHRHVDGKPNETDGTISDEPASEKAAADLIESAGAPPLDDGEKKVAGTVAHYLFGVIAGAAYGAAAAKVPQVAAGGGAPYGVFVWLVAVEAGLPLTGLSKSPTHYRPVRHAASLGTHLVFGLTVDAVRRWMTRR